MQKTGATVLFITPCGEAEHKVRTIGTTVAAVQTIMIYIEKNKKWKQAVCGCLNILCIFEHTDCRKQSCRRMATTGR